MNTKNLCFNHSQWQYMRGVFTVNLILTISQTPCAWREQFEATSRKVCVILQSVESYHKSCYRRLPWRAVSAQQYFTPGPSLMLHCLCINTSATWTESTFPPHMAGRCQSWAQVAFIGHLNIGSISCCVFMRRCCELEASIVLSRCIRNDSSCCFPPSLLRSFSMTTLRLLIMYFHTGILTVNLLC